MESITNLDHAQLFFKLLTNKARIRTANLLTKVNKISVGDIAEFVGMEQSMTSRYLGDIKKCRLVDIERVNQNNFYSLTNEGKILLVKVLEEFQNLPEIKADNDKISRLKGL
jgi:DNA-binding transcriptional ArsR family regulator